jgi:glycosyltransferase involved in cell wall biosynthesis
VVHNLAPGGAHRRLAQQAAQLDADVVELTLSTATPVTGDAIVVPYEPLAPRVVRPMRPPLRYVDLSGLVRAWARAWRRAARVAPDVLYVNPCRFLQAPPVLTRRQRPALYFCDEPRRVDAEPEAAATRNPRTRTVYGPLYRAQRRLDRAGVAGARAIATNSRYTAGLIRRTYGRAAEVVPLGVDEHFTPKGGVAARHLLSVGTLIPAKGHDLVLRASAAARTPWPVVVVAPRPDASEAARLRALAHELGVRLDVRVGISDAALRDCYRSAHATLYLARREPLGLASLEAQACGSPVIVADEGGLPETVSEGITGWAVPREPGAVARRIDGLADPGARAGMSAAAASRGRAASWSRSATRIQRLLRELVE